MDQEKKAVPIFDDFPPPSFNGIVVRPGDETYVDTCRIPNTRWDNTPALVARCHTVDDVVAVVQYCNARDQPFAIRSGGHALDGHAMPKDAFVMDMSPMKKIDVDPTTGIVSLESGVLLGEMDAATQEHGLVIPSGTNSLTGIAGLSLGGGMGYLTRSLGMTVDNMVSVQVVTVDGRKLTASLEENPELFWGMRGAGHNLAVATTFTFQAHKLGPEVMSGPIIFDIDDAVEMLVKMNDFMDAAPRELSIFPIFLPALPIPNLPAPTPGKNMFALLVVYTGKLDKYEEAVAPLWSLAEPLAKLVQPSTWVETNAIIDLLVPGGRRRHHRGGYLSSITREVAEAAIKLITDAPAPVSEGPSTAICFPCLAGVHLERDEDSTSYSREGAKWYWEAHSQWDEEKHDKPFVDWVDSVMETMKPHSLQNGYVNLSTDRGPEWLRLIYGSPEKWARLCALKEEFDPKNLLRHNKNIARAREAMP